MNTILDNCLLVEVDNEDYQHSFEVLDFNKFETVLKPAYHINFLNKDYLRNLLSMWESSIFDLSTYNTYLFPTNDSKSLVGNEYLAHGTFFHKGYSGDKFVAQNGLRSAISKRMLQELESHNLYARAKTERLRVVEKEFKFKFVKNHWYGIDTRKYRKLTIKNYLNIFNNLKYLEGPS